MHRKSIFKIKLDYTRSHGAFLYDLNRQEEVLDLFGLYSSLPLGYNHPVFKEAEFQQEILEAAAVKIPNNEMATVPADKFLDTFSSHPSMKPFKYFHFTCTGALAVEAALKAAHDYRGSSPSPRLIGFKKSFHGIYGYPSFITDRFGGVRARLDGLPGPFATLLDNPVLQYKDGDVVVDANLRERVLTQISDLCRNDNNKEIVGILIEPIQCTAGDYPFDPQFLKEVRKIASEFDIPLIFDEVQTGFGGTGTLWYFEQTGVVPDIVVFGKKTQTSGIMVREAFGSIFQRPVRLEVTWDGDVLDMIRCRTILEAYQRFNILENVQIRGRAIVERLRSNRELKNVRHVGLMIAFDFDTKDQRDAYMQGLRQNRAIALPTQERSVRWRPHLAFTAQDSQLAFDITEAVLRPNLAALKT